MKVCSRPGCPTIIANNARRGLCDEHRRAHDRARGTAEQRGYGRAFQAARRNILAKLNRGETIPCWRCGQPVTTDFHLGHADHDRTVIRGPEHPTCNLSAAGRAAHPQGREASRPPALTVGEVPRSP